MDDDDTLCLRGAKRFDLFWYILYDSLGCDNDLRIWVRVARWCFLAVEVEMHEISLRSGCSPFDSHNFGEIRYRDCMSLEMGSLF